MSGGVDVESGSEWETVAVACQRIDTHDGGGDDLEGPLTPHPATLTPSPLTSHPQPPQVRARSALIRP